MEQATGSPKGSVNLTGIGKAKAASIKGRRRRRDIQCDKTDRSGDAIVFDIVLDYPNNLECHTLNSDDGSYIPVDLCHVQPYPNINSNDDETKSAKGVTIEPTTTIATTTTTTETTITTAKRTTTTAKKTITTTKRTTTAKKTTTTTKRTTTTTKKPTTTTPPMPTTTASTT
ncbi:unnamed protein product, partial [Adineta steineri]